MPSSTGKQHRFMAMASSAKGRNKLAAEGVKVPPKAVANEFLKADKGKSFKKKG